MNSQIKTVSILTAISLVAVGIIASSGMTTSLFVAPTNVVAEQGGIMGHISLEVYDSEGNIKMYRQLDNQIVNQGENCVVEALFGTTSSGTQQCAGTPGTFNKIAIGTGSAAVSSADTDLGTETDRSGAITPSAPTSSSGAGTTSAVQVISQTFTAAAPVDLRESGLFDSTGAGAGNMFARQTFGTVPLNTDDTITVDWTITIGPN